MTNPKLPQLPTEPPRHKAGRMDHRASQADKPDKVDRPREISAGAGEAISGLAVAALEVGLDSFQ